MATFVDVACAVVLGAIALLGVHFAGRDWVVFMSGFMGLSFLIDEGARVVGVPTGRLRLLVSLGAGAGVSLLLVWGIRRADRRKRGISS